MSNQYSESETNVLNLESLNAKYNNLLIQYKQAVSDYITYLNNYSEKQKNMFTNIQGQAFWGTGQAGQQSAYNVSNVNSCSALCSRTSGCTGATFNPTTYSKPMCQLRTGNADPVISSASDYAIIPQEKEILFNIQYINNQLTSVNNQILNIINNNRPLYESQIDERSEKNSILIANYEKLTKERNKIRGLIGDYEGLDRAQTDGDLRANQNYYSFLLLLVVAIFIIILLFRFTSYTPDADYGGALGGSVFNIILSVLIIIFIYYAFIRNLL